MQTCDPCVFLQKAFTWHLSGYVWHSSISVKKKTLRRKRKEWKWDLVFIQKSYMCMYMKKVDYLFAIFWFHAILGLDLSVKALFCIFFFTLSKAYAINCSCFATGAQNTLYKQQKKERTKIRHLWPHFLVILNSPVQFCPFPVYPGWQSHTCDPLVLVQFASSWQEWFPLHSSMSMKSQMKKWDFRIMQKLTCISHYYVEECKPWLFSNFFWMARTRDFLIRSLNNF